MQSSNYLFHYTSHINNISSIIDNGIWVKRSIEDVSYLKEIIEIDFEAFFGEKSRSEREEIEYKISIPMACFCDIPLNQTNDHRKIYGNCAIGFHKNWGIKKGINPVTYLVPESDYSTAIRKLNALTSSISTKDPQYDIRNALFKITSFLKLYEGPYEKGSYKHKNHRFYNEREWRFIPKGDYIQIAPPKLLRPEAKDIEATVQVSLSDIKFLLVEKEEEKGELRELFKKKGASLSKYSDLEIVSFQEINK